jgi:hypothetical protein
MALTLKTVGPARGAHWVRDGLRLYLRRPLAFTMLFLLFMVVAMLSALVPLVGGVLQMMLVPLLSLGMMVASQSALLQGPVQPRQFVEPFRGPPAQTRSLLLLCAVYGVVVLLTLWLCNVIADDGFVRALELMRRQPPAPQEEIDALLAERPMVAGTLFGMVVLTLISVPFWHAPALVHWGGQSALQALFSSALAVWRSRGAFLVYGLSWFALVLVFGLVSAGVLAVFGAGQLASLVAVPAGLFFSTLFYVSLIFTFNDSFGSA